MPRLPVTVFTGFLGSGKTTLLTSLLAAERQQRFAIVVNEFGAVSVDDVLLQYAVDERYARIFKITTGLIAYAGDEFHHIMQAISAESRFFDHVLIETSGLAVPTAVLEALHNTVLQEHFLHDATLTVVDTPVLLSGAYHADAPSSDASSGAAVSAVFQQQLRCADVVILNKIDQCTADDLWHAETAVRTRAPDIRFVELAWNARLDARLVLGLHLNEFRAHVPGGAASAGSAMPSAAHVHSGLGAHEHGLLTHEHLHEEDPGWLSFVLRTETPQDPTRLHAALSAITSHAPVLRVKGFAHVPDAPGHLLVQGVSTRITCTMESATSPPAEHHTHETSPAHHPPPTPTHTHQAMAELVFIGYHLERQHIVADLCAHTGTVWY